MFLEIVVSQPNLSLYIYEKTCLFSLDQNADCLKVDKIKVNCAGKEIESKTSVSYLGVSLETRLLLKFFLKW